MGKKHKKFEKNTYTDSDGFAVLVRRSATHVACFTDETEVETLRKQVEMWKDQCEMLMNANEALKNALDTAEETIELLSTALETGTCGTARPNETSFDSGIGFSYETGKDPRVYRLSDLNGDVVPKTKFKGVTAELKPGRGFHVKLRFGK